MSISQAIVLTLLTMTLATTAAAGPVVWTEGESFTKATNTQRQNTSVKPPASGSKSLFGASLRRKGLVVQYTFTLAEPIDAGQIIFRYCRLHWNEDMVPAAIRMELTGPREPITQQLAFADTKGWGLKPNDWRLLAAQVGGLSAGKWTLTLTSLADNNSINMDGFFVAPAGFKITAEELSSLLRLQITSEGYAGFRARSAAIRQDQTKTLTAAVRSFVGMPTRQVTARIAKDQRAWTDLDTSILAMAERPGASVALCTLPDLRDGPYWFQLASTGPACRFELPLTLLGDFMSTLDAHMPKVEAFANKLAAMNSPAAAACKADFKHAVAFLQAGRDTITKSVAQPKANAWKEHPAQAEVLSDPAPLAINMAAMLTHCEQTMARIEAGKMPYEGRAGQSRRGYCSEATGDPLVYRIYVPTGYAKAESVPLILMLHGKGGDENTFHDMDGGAILRVLEDRGYVMVAPQYDPQTQPTHLADLRQLIELTRQQYPKTDPERIYVTGHSMGGFTSCHLATDSPELFAAAGCVGGSGDPKLAPKLATTPLLILQGGADTVIAPEGAKAVAARLTELSLPHEIHIFPNHGHEYHAEQYIKVTLDFFEKAGPKKR